MHEREIAPPFIIIRGKRGFWLISGLLIRGKIDLMDVLQAIR